MAVTEILKIKGDWQEVVDDCRVTVDKPPLGHEPSSDFKKNILIAEHDPIRDIEIKFRWTDIPYWVAMHWKTHIWRSRVNSQRNDRQSKYDRTKAPQDAPVTFTGDMNAQHAIDTMRKRLCYQASSLTRQYAENFKRTLKEQESEISNVLVPNCVYRCGCPEINSKCKQWQRFVEWCINEQGIDVRLIPIQERYDLYNKWFYRGDANE